MARLYTSHATSLYHCATGASLVYIEKMDVHVVSPAVPVYILLIFSADWKRGKL